MPEPDRGAAAVRTRRPRLRLRRACVLGSAFTIYRKYRPRPARERVSGRRDLDKRAIDQAPRLTSRHQISYALMMRTTLSLDDDVAATLERLRRSRRISLKRLVNEALRRGLDDMGRRRKPREAVRTRAVTLGRVQIAGIDNIGEALAIAEGESFK